MCNSRYDRRCTYFFLLVQLTLVFPRNYVLTLYSIKTSGAQNWGTRAETPTKIFLY